MTGALDMTLDDMISSSGGRGGKGGKKGGKGRREDSDGGWRKGGKSKGKGSNESGGDKDTKLDMALDDVIWSDGDSGRKGKGKSKGKGKGKSDYWDDWSSKGSWGSKGGPKGKGKGDGWGSKGGDSWGRGGGGGGGGKGVPRWMEHDDWRVDEGSWEKPSAMKSDWHDWRGGGESWGSGGGGGYAPPARRRSPSWRRVDQPASNGRGDRERGGMRSAMGEGRPSAAATKRGRDDGEGLRGVKRIKVTNVPRDLAARDIKEAFESEAGKTTSCELDRGTAFLTFLRPADARKAVETFDRGELNGKTIHVTLEQ